MQKSKEKIRLAILYGGPGGEHEVSVRSAQNILENIDSAKYEVKEIFLPKTTKIISNKILEILRAGKFLVWPIFHGEFGEGGYVQEVLEKNKIKFIGSGSKASKLAIDKFKTQKALEKNNILCPKSFLLDKDTRLEKILSQINFPIILKPVNSGSSVDLHKPKNKIELELSLKVLFKKYKQVLLQEFISGREFTCGVMNIGKKVLPLPVSEVVLNGQDVFDYEAKYATNGIEFTPAKIDKKTSDKIKKLGKKVHQVIGCLGVTRTDMIMDTKGKIYILEINTIPGLTKVSFVPEQLKCHGISIPEFMDSIVKSSL